MTSSLTPAMSRLSSSDTKRPPTDSIKDLTLDFQESLPVIDCTSLRSLVLDSLSKQMHKTAQFFALFESLNALRSVATVGLVAFINKILLLIQVGTGDQGTCQPIKLRRGRIDTI